ncbi:unnamed protein product [Dovyalis caffra]|uniref:Wall-associated receptor kinase galacturonan-binding domain-containing protein n=1 Tax=Dovyalis caffra TaxID=77055 RepID=A0AAV1S3D6_9ROSI|nr:unnamed protein product [Dovyalis caffra]
MAEQVQLMLQVMMLLLLLFNFPFVIVEAQSIAKAGCDDQCGGVRIPYPFGMNSSCYLEESYKIDCNSSTPTIHINGTNLVVTEISVGVAKNTTIHVNLPIVFKDCEKTLSSSNSYDVFVVDLKGSPFVFSETDNWFIGGGCNNLALLANNESSCFGGCMSICEEDGMVASTIKSTSCSGINCCQTTIPSNLKRYQMTQTRQSFNVSAAMAFKAAPTFLTVATISMNARYTVPTLAIAGPSNAKTPLVPTSV